jgi:hypothetical protein
MCEVGTLSLRTSVFLPRVAYGLSRIKCAYSVTVNTCSAPGCCWEVRKISIFLEGTKALTVPTIVIGMWISGVSCWPRKATVLCWRREGCSLSEGSHKSLVKKESPEGNSDQTQIRGPPFRSCPTNAPHSLWSGSEHWVTGSALWFVPAQLCSLSFCQENHHHAPTAGHQLSLQDLLSYRKCFLTPATKFPQPVWPSCKYFHDPVKILFQG